MRDTANQILALDENNIEALQIFGKANVELGKKEENSCQLIQVGIKNLEKALMQCRNGSKQVRSQFEAKLARELRIAEKIASMKQLYTEQNQKENVLLDLKNKMKALDKLRILFKVPKAERADLKLLQRQITDKYNAEEVKNIKQLNVPEHLVCLISGEIMFDPVTIESGRTFEKEFIEMFFKNQTELMERARVEYDPDDEESQGRPFNEADYLFCPVNRTPVDTEIQIPNMGMRAELDKFLKKNPWAFEFDPRKNFNQVKIWE